MPSSPCLMNAGSNHNLNQLSSCFILPIEDDMESIYDALKQQALITKACGGTGFSFGNLRQNKALVKGLPVASGPVSFMRVFDASTGAVKQGRRRGANLGVLPVNHPDILEFINCKNDNVSFPNFNISVAITDEFMKAVKDHTNYDLIEPHTGKVIGQLDANMVWNQIFINAHKTGDPGIIFIDRCNKDNPVPHLGKILSGNPCLEYVFIPYGSCNLGSINLSLCVKDGKPDWNKINHLVDIGVRFIDNMLTMNELPLPQLKDMAMRTRPIGLGVMGWHHFLIQLGIPYASQEALDMAELVSRIIREYAIDSSSYLALERGTFPEWKESIWGKLNLNVRNSTQLSIAPNGTISIFCDTTGGIEPLFSVAFTRNIVSNNETKMQFVDPIFKQMVECSPELLQEIIDNNGTIQGNKKIPSYIQTLFQTAQEISPEWHVRMQAAWQKNVDLSISKTVNMPSNATVNDVKQVYELAYELGCKGVTVYLDGSKTGQPLTKGNNHQSFIKPTKRPIETEGKTKEYKVGCGKIYITINEDKGKLVESFVNTGAMGVCPGFSTGLSRMTSLALRCGIDPDDIVDQLTSVTCGNCKGKRVDAKSCPDAYGKEIKRRYNQISKKSTQMMDMSKNNENITMEVNMEDNTEVTTEDKAICPECGEKLIFTTGCKFCECGYGACN